MQQQLLPKHFAATSTAYLQVCSGDGGWLLKETWRLHKRSGCALQRCQAQWEEITAAPNAGQVSALQASRALAAVRATEHLRQSQPLFLDPYAATLAEAAVPQPAAQGTDAEPMLPRSATDSSSQQPYDAITTAFIDENLLKAVGLVNMDLKEEYNQVVLLGCAFDTRPYRIPWPQGTLLFVVGHPEVHAIAAHALKRLGASVPRGCLLRRVAADLQHGESFADGLGQAGFRGDRLSAWGLQGLSGLQLGMEQMHSILTDVTNMASFNSFVLGELPPMTSEQCNNLLSSFGLLGHEVAFGSELAHYGRWNSTAGSDLSLSRRLFISQHQKLSLQEMGIYSAHVQAAEETDEDFEGHFS